MTLEVLGEMYEGDFDHVDQASIDRGSENPTGRDILEGKINLPSILYAVYCTISA
jgi:hypothetical protein